MGPELLIVTAFPISQIKMVTLGEEILASRYLLALWGESVRFGVRNWDSDSCGPC